MRVLLPAYPGLIARPEAGSEVWSDPELSAGRRGWSRGRSAGRRCCCWTRRISTTGRAGSTATGRRFPRQSRTLRGAVLGGALRSPAKGCRDGWTPDILHAHDWQAGCAGLSALRRRYPVKTVMTIHNIAFQGLAPAAMLGAAAAVGGFNSDGLEYWGQLSSLKAGLVTADAITTVSPTYAAELMRPRVRHGAAGRDASARATACTGILNGVDTDVWDPATDPEIAAFSMPNRARAGRREPRRRCWPNSAWRRCRGRWPSWSPADRAEGDRPDPRRLRPSSWRRAAGLPVLGSGDALAGGGDADRPRPHPGRVGGADRL